MSTGICESPSAGQEEVICERCYQPTTQGQHGWMVCPLEPRQDWAASFIGGKDKQYEFQHPHLPGQPSFRSKGQYYRYLKQHGLTDDVSAKELTSMSAKRQYRPKHDLKRWWAQRAGALRGIVNKPALARR